jgi:hypothetical protein
MDFMSRRSIAPMPSGNRRIYRYHQGAVACNFGALHEFPRESAIELDMALEAQWHVGMAGDIFLAEITHSGLGHRESAPDWQLRSQVSLSVAFMGST